MLGPGFSHPLRLGGLGRPAGVLRQFRWFRVWVLGSRVEGLGLIGFRVCIQCARGGALF